MSKWYKPKGHSGWKKSQSPEYRRRLVLKAHKHSYLSAGRSMQALANVTKDKPTEKAASADARYFFKKCKEKR